MLSEQLKIIRKANKFTQQGLADAIGIERSTYASYETGRNKPDAVLLSKIAKVFDVSSEFILEIDTTVPLNVEDISVQYKKKSGNKLVSTLSKEEKSVLAKYRLLSDDKKAELVDFLEKNTALK
ncbi:MAG: helix-turn-helix transcriptional regulator [Oscillospiraceae bacterium]|nr:helix-turn-helix transcriptional regulator [Oscillospiraceae bacterium]